MASSLAFIGLLALLPAVAQGAPCKCKFGGTTLPEAAANKSGNRLYGTSCKLKWDSLPGTVYYKNATECPPELMCNKSCNYLQQEWCYVEPGCTGAAHFNTTLEGVGDLAYSYEVCGNPYCWHPYGWEAGCPDGAMCEPSRCKCKYEGTTLPDVAANKAGNRLYGTSCKHKWDSFPGTVYYKSDTECPVEDSCKKGCNYRQLEWCYVEPGCKGAAHFNTTLEGVGAMAYSYEVCGNPYCWDPYGWDAFACPAGEACKETTCGAIKSAYKASNCCGNPGKKLSMFR